MKINRYRNRILAGILTVLAVFVLTVPVVRAEADENTSILPQQQEDTAVQNAVNEGENPGDDIVIPEQEEPLESKEGPSSCSNGLQTPDADGEGEETDEESAYLMTDSATGIRAEADLSVVPQGILFYVTPVNQGEPYEMLVQLLSVRAENFAAYDLRFIDLTAGGEYRPAGKVSYTIPVPSEYDTDRLSVWRIDTETMERQDVSFSFENGSVMVETDRTGLFVVAQTKIMDLPASLDPTEKVEKLELSKTTYDSPKRVYVNTSSHLAVPQTGDESPIGVWIILFVAAGAAVVVLFVIRKKK